MLIREMNRRECIDLVASGHVARLACAHDTQPYVVPIYFAFADHCLYSFSMPGRKIEWMRANPSVCVQMDDTHEHHGWRSVVIDGLYEELPDTDQWRSSMIHAWSLLSRHANWWEPGGLKPGPVEIASRSDHLFYRIRIVDLTGRLAFDDEHRPAAQEKAYPGEGRFRQRMRRLLRPRTRRG